MHAFNIIQSNGLRVCVASMVLLLLTVAARRSDANTTIQHHTSPGCATSVALDSLVWTMSFTATGATPPPGVYTVQIKHSPANGGGLIGWKTVTVASDGTIGAPTGDVYGVNAYYAAGLQGIVLHVSAAPTGGIVTYNNAPTGFVVENVCNNGPGVGHSENIQVLLSGGIPHITQFGIAIEGVVGTA